MALLDDVGKAIGKVSQGISDAAQAVSAAAQETMNNIERDRKERQDSEENEQAVEKEESPKNCPMCGYPFSGIAAVCPMCGYEIRNAKTAQSISNLTKEINRLNQNRNTFTDAIATKLSGRHENPTDEKIASLIQNFVVPNTKEDIIEFMILAAGYMDARFLAGKKKVSQTADIVIRAWASKFEQTYQKAKFSFGQDKDFEQIENYYNEKMEEIENERHFSLFRRKK